MQFTSPQFIAFFALVLLLSRIVGAQGKKWLLLIASLLFIAFFNLESAIAVIVFSTFNFVVAKRLQQQRSPVLFYTAIALNCLSIIVFNYISGHSGSFHFSLKSIEFNPGVFFLAIGLSFYSLQYIAYLIDVQKRRIISETNYFDFLLISAYFPKIISGPLTLYQYLKPQLNNQAPDKALLWLGFNRMLIGFLKKMVIADRLAPSVSSIFDYNDDLPGLTVLTGGLVFTIQLYFDFSGYCDIAIGTSKMLGIDLKENFNYPLRSASITVFWRRWHMTLISFFTTYIFYPVSFRYRKLKKHAIVIAIIVTFLISGIWHGIGLTFMMWALCHMFYLIFELYFRRNADEIQHQQNKFKKRISIFVVLLLISFSNIFFRSTGTENCFHLLSELFSIHNFLPKDWLVEFIAPLAVGGHQMEHFNLFVTVFFTGLMLRFERKIFMKTNSATFKALIVFIVLAIIFVFGVFDNGQRFIYMQF